MFLVMIAMSSLVMAETFEAGGVVSSSGGGGCEYNVGTIADLPRLSTDVVPDYIGADDGYLLYLYCSWETSDGQGESLIPMNAGDMCPYEGQVMELEYGDNTYTAVITTIEANYDEGWQFGNPQIVNQTEQVYNACYPEPDAGFVSSVVAFILNWLCGLFSFGWCAV